MPRKTGRRQKPASFVGNQAINGVGHVSDGLGRERCIHLSSGMEPDAARCIRGKVITPVPARRAGHGAAAFVGAAVGAEIAFVDVCVAVPAYAAGTDTTINSMAAKRSQKI